MRVYIQEHISQNNVYLQEYITGIEFNMTQGLCKNSCQNKKKTGLILKQRHPLIYIVIYFQLFTSPSLLTFCFLITLLSFL